MRTLRVLCVGAGHFRRFHYEAWPRIGGIEAACICDREQQKAAAAAAQFDVLMQATDVHRALDEMQPDFIDTFRYLNGQIVSVYAVLRQRNSVIAGEDCGLIVFEFAEGAIGIWDANRYNQCNGPDPRNTFGEFPMEGSRQ